MQIINLKSDDQNAIDQAAHILYEGFKEMWPYMCPDIAATAEIIKQSLVPERVFRAAVNETGQVLGLAGAVPEYDGKAWCIHPMAVHSDNREQGIGRALVADLEERVRERGGGTLFLGTDDTLKMTSLGGVDLYPNVMEHVANIRNLGHHPYEFYQKLGYAIVGVIPDANGFGKPDIFMAKRLIDER